MGYALLACLFKKMKQNALNIHTNQYAGGNISANSSFSDWCQQSLNSQKQFSLVQNLWNKCSFSIVVLIVKFKKIWSVSWHKDNFLKNISSYTIARKQLWEYGG